MIHVDADRLRAALPMADAVAALRAALAGGLRPEADPPRTAVELPAGQVLLMPAAGPRVAGVKIVSVAPDNPARGLPRIYGAYVLLAADTLAPLAVLDGTELTSLRTPAMSALAADLLAPPDAANLVVFGTGPQAWGHVHALGLVRSLTRITVVGRSAGRADQFAQRCRAAGLPAAPGTADAVAGADLVACCTTAREPLFDGSTLRPDATVLAIGSHEPDAREVDGPTVARSTVVVESRAAALAEAGDIIGAIRDGLVGPDHIAGDVGELVRGEMPVRPGRPRFYKSVGMAWQDLVVAAAAYDRTS